MHTDEHSFRTFLINSGLLSRPDIDDAQKKSRDTGHTLDIILINQGKLTENDIRKIQSHIHAIPFVDLQHHRIGYEVISLIPEPISRKHSIIAFEKDGDMLKVALLDIADLEHIDFIKKDPLYKHLIVVPHLTTSESIRSTLLTYQQKLREIFNTSVRSLQQKAHSSLATLEALLKHASLQRATEIIIEPTEYELVVRYRINNTLHDALVLPKTIHGSLCDDIQDSAVSLKKTDMGRLSIFHTPTIHGNTITIHIVPHTDLNTGFTLETLGFHGTCLENLRQAIFSTQGLILITGPEKSGKTTTAYTILDIINRPDMRVSTIENNIEHKLKRISQSQIRPDIGFTYAEGLRALLRQGSNVIMIGEIRDTETAAIAVSAAATGHLIISTVSTEDMNGPIGVILSASKNATVISQRLLSRLPSQPLQGERYNLTAAEIRTLSSWANLETILSALLHNGVIKNSGTWETIPFYRSKSGGEKNHSTQPTEKMIGIQAGCGHLSLVEDGLYKATLGLTTIEEVLAACT